ncbi:DUF1057 domain containing protein-like protein [Leptotrombidium deliense]|uniref:DUF1057 domain containing protein-like protein n=1 Tax=Leptotrombidium deliense TaxID=299467 RepID=A0A443SFN6_9ACAR|nr:DUF1057 domain containing protein-like protein [Leptotrombidium deliense]
MNENEYPIKYVEIKTCGRFYEERKKTKKLYKNANPEGISTEVEYVDTKDISGDEKPLATVLCLHGAPGSHRDFAALIKHLTNKRVRVIAPNFPNYCITETTKVFRHSADEKAEYIKDFLDAIAVKKIDLLVTHSSAIYPSALLWESNTSPDITAIAMINPSGHRRIKAMRPKIVTSPVVRVYQNKYGRFLVRKFGSHVLSVTGCAVKHNNMDNVILSATTMVYSRFKTLSKKLEAMKEKEVPVLLIYSDNDRLIENEIFDEMKSILGADESNTEIFDETGELMKPICGTELPKAICLKGGGHYSHLKGRNPEIVNDAIYNLLENVVNNDY